jgi:glycosyltransferase involved in cell wall biosynthesis
VLREKGEASVGLLRRAGTHRVNNYFGADRDRRILISYTTRPFCKGVSLHHTNTAEALAMAEVCHAMGFVVDVVDYCDADPVDYDRYDAILGFGEPLIHRFYETDRQITTVYYGTGMPAFRQNAAALSRVADVHRKKGVWMPESVRLADKTWSIQTSLVDAIITLGNETVIAAYQACFPGRIYNVPVTFFSPFPPGDLQVRKQYEQARRHFLWFGSGGLIHKGLDLVLDVFRDLPDLDLHVAGPLDKEKRFLSCYHSELYETPNVHAHGFVELDSDLYGSLLETCGYVILPSCSEGEPSSVVNPMAYGLVPVVPDTAGIRVEDFGMRLQGLAVPQIRQAVTACASLAPEDLKDRSCRCLQHTRQTHSLDAYQRRLTDSLSDILGSQDPGAAHRD